MVYTSLELSSPRQNWEIVPLRGRPLAYRNLRDLTVLCLLRGRPMHPYEAESAEETSVDPHIQGAPRGSLDALLPLARRSAIRGVAFCDILGIKV